MIFHRTAIRASRRDVAHVLAPRAGTWKPPGRRPRRAPAAITGTGTSRQTSAVRIAGPVGHAMGAGVPGSHPSVSWWNGRVDLLGHLAEIADMALSRGGRRRGLRRRAPRRARPFRSSAARRHRPAPRTWRCRGRSSCSVRTIRTSATPSVMVIWTAVVHFRVLLRRSRNLALLTQRPARTLSPTPPSCERDHACTADRVVGVAGADARASPARARPRGRRPRSAAVARDGHRRFRLRPGGGSRGDRGLSDRGRHPRRWPAPAGHRAPGARRLRLRQCHRNTQSVGGGRGVGRRAVRLHLVRPR